MCTASVGMAYVRTNAHTNTVTLARIESYKRGTASAVIDCMRRYADMHDMRFVIELAHNPIIQFMARRRGMSRINELEPSYETRVLHQSSALT